MERAYAKKYRQPMTLQAADVWCAMMGSLLGGISGVLEPVFVFLFLTHAYVRSNRETFITLLFLLPTTFLLKGMIDVYFYALSCALFFVLVQAVRLGDRNLYVWLPAINAISALPCLWQEAKGSHMLLFAILLYGLSREMLAEDTWVRRCFVLADVMHGGLWIAVALFFGQTLVNVDYALLLTALLPCALLCRASSMALYIMALYLSHTITYSGWLLVPFFICCFHHRKSSALLLLLGFGIGYARDLVDIGYLVLAGSSLFMKREMLPLTTPLQEPTDAPITRLPPENLLRRQIQNYASIFEALQDYYASISTTQAELLGNMAKALQYQAEELQKQPLSEQNKERILQALEGYQFQVDRLDMEEFCDGTLRMTLHISHLQKQEIATTLQPLLEALLQRHLRVMTVHDRRFAKGYCIQMEDDIPFVIEVDGDSLKNTYTSNGDTFSIFRFRQSLVCMISDGMGNGDKAAQSSRLISSIFQKMMVSGIPQDSAIRCINKLVQSDTYATLDVICFNRSQGVAYLSKSAACPTYLLREHKLYEISGNALPVGIVAQIQPDCFEFALREGDEFVMSSDGIQLHEIYEWMKERKGGSMREDVSIFMDLLQRKPREDDSTLIIARVKKYKA